MILLSPNVSYKSVFALNNCMQGYNKCDIGYRFESKLKLFTFLF